MSEDEDIERAIRRDPRFLIRLIVLLVLLLVGLGVALVSIGNLNLGTKVAEGFATVTGSPPPDAGTPR